MVCNYLWHYLCLLVGWEMELSDKYLLYSVLTDGWTIWDLAVTLAEVLNALSTSLQPRHC